MDSIPIFNTIDAGAPSSEVLALPDTTESLSFTVNWSGSDDAGGSGIKSYSIYYADNGDPYQLWQQDSVPSSAEFVGEHDHTYEFYSVVTDNVGWVEDAPSAPDAQTTVWYTYTCGDVDDSKGVPDIGDLTLLIEVLFLGGEALPKPEAADVDCSGSINIADLVYFVEWAFLSGPDLCAPCSSPVAKPQVSEHGGTCDLITQAMTDHRYRLVVRGDFETEVAGFQQEYEYDGNALTIDSIIPGEKNAKVELFYSTEDNKITLGMIDLSGKEYIKAGQSDVAYIYFHLNQDLELGKDRLSHSFTIAVGRHARIMPVTINAEMSSPEIPGSYALHQNYPNPFNATTRIKYDLPRASRVSIVVFNILGQRVTTLVDGKQPAGYHEVVWDGRNKEGNTVASGVYFYRIDTEGFESSKKMVLLK